MGTAGYMAPEQVNGEEVDHRADLFAFGAVLYGMVTGRQAFGGKNVHETLGSTSLSDEPEADHRDPTRNVAADWNCSGLSVSRWPRSPVGRYQHGG